MLRLADDAGKRVVAAVSLLDVVSRYVRLKKSGPDDFTGLCPFHHERTPSFVVHPSRAFFRCFGCGKAGDVIHFVRGIENKTYPEAVTLLGEEFGVDITSQVETRAERASKRIESELVAAEARWFWREHKRRLWVDFKMAQSQVIRFYEWSQSNTADDLGMDLLATAWDAAEIVMESSWRSLEIVWSYDVRTMVKLYSRVRTSQLSKEIQSLIARDPLERVAVMARSM